MKVLSNIIEKEKKTSSIFITCNNGEEGSHDVENESKTIYNQTGFIKSLLDHYNQNPDSEPACIGKTVNLVLVLKFQLCRIAKSSCTVNVFIFEMEEDQKVLLHSIHCLFLFPAKLWSFHWLLVHKTRIRLQEKCSPSGELH